jgi:N-methylhydantoinase A/oxoprolinase/acetone carboxylase beta subunit
VEELSDMVYDKVKKTLYMNIIRMLLEERYPDYRRNGLGQGLEALISESWETAKKRISSKSCEKSQDYKGQDFLKFEFKTPAALVGIGAPIHIFLPDVAKVLGTRCVIPENAGVANALGAVVSNVTAACEIEIKPAYSTSGISGYTVYGREHNSYVKDLDEAIQIALIEAERAAREEAIQRGVSGEITVTSEVITDTAAASEKTEIFLGAKVIGVAVGGISFS